MRADEAVPVGVITGVGQSGPLRGLSTVVVETPYGQPSMPVRIGSIAGKRIALLARRGDEDELQPHHVPYRANVWALASLGVRTLITSTASSGLRDAFAPGCYVIPDQILDFTQGRPNTFFDTGDAVQVDSAEPFDPTLRALLGEVLSGLGVRVRDHGTVAVTEGPRFPTKAEARWFAASGADMTNKTLMPETTLARELGMGVVNVSFVTDWAPGHGDSDQGSNAELIRRRSAQASATLVQALGLLLERIPESYRPRSDIHPAQIAAVLDRE